jgi:hypothetical protein
MNCTNKYLTDIDKWEIIDTTHHNMHFLWRKPLTFHSDTDSETGDALFEARMQFSCFASDWRGVYGVSGV